MANFEINISTMKHHLVFTDWNENIKKISFVDLLRERAGMSFHSAKRVLEALLLREETIIDVPNAAIAKELKKEATKLGAICKIVRVNSKKKVLVHA
ncbi:MAG: hypothetical protein ACT4ON_08390 [Bacteroidota bacterium]